MREEMEIGLTIGVVYQDNDLIEVRVCVWNGKFGGATNAYVGVGELEEAAVKLRGFPTHAADTREIVLGAFGSDSAGGGVRIRLRCTDAAAHISAKVDIESEHGDAGTFESATLFL